MDRILSVRLMKAGIGVGADEGGEEETVEEEVEATLVPGRKTRGVLLAL